MGFFSEDCRRCGHPALSALFTNGVNAWMNEVVAIWPNDDLTVGIYDGYGRVNDIEYVIGAEVEYGQGNTIYHRACWEMAGKPMRYGGSCRRSADQGWLFDAGAHDLPDPRSATKREHPGSGVAGPAEDQHEQVVKRGGTQLDPDGWSFGL